MEYDKYIKYKNKYIELKRELAEHNIFYYLNEFKKKVLDIVWSSYSNPNAVSKNSVEGMFMKWYLNSIENGYIPKDKFNIKSDILYQDRKYGFKLKPTEIMDLVNKEVIELNNKVKYVNDEYTYKPIFSKIQLELLKKKYTGPENEYNKHINFLSELYSFMGGLSNHMSVPPALIPENCIELFGTPVNTRYKFCSPFIIEKEHFSSLGSFFDYDIKSGMHIANPPFDEDIMARMVNRLNEQLNKNTQTDIIIVIPKWSDLIAYKNMLISKYHKKNRTINKQNCVFFNYYDQSHVAVVDCYIIHFSNYETKFDIDDFISKWSSIKPGKHIA